MPMIGKPMRFKAPVSPDFHPALTESLRAQARLCKGDDPHSPKCKRCARGARGARTA
ncbi:hypothetical protein [Gordonia sp. MMO-8]|uniref:hypothetical protein n=1 Tax=Gordonia sp. MMO-8 TaxID=3127886 RepID=UPI003018110A